MTSLIERIEAATGPDRELDAEICRVLGVAGGNPINAPGCAGWLVGTVNNPNPVQAPRYTGSLDAALTLAHGEDMWRIGHDGEGPYPDRFRARIITWDTGRAFNAVHDVAAIAICLAALRARGVM